MYTYNVSGLDTNPAILRDPSILEIYRYLAGSATSLKCSIRAVWRSVDL